VQILPAQPISQGELSLPMFFDRADVVCGFCESLLLDVPTALRPQETAKVFSLNIKTQFLDYLRSILEGISADHLQAIRDLYGDDHLHGVPTTQNIH
jgi:hypothetical protein